MPFPIISDIAAMLKGESSDAPAESIDTTTVEEVAAETTTAETIEETPASAPSAESPPVSTSTPEAPTVAGLLSTKGAAALIAELPEDLRDQLGSELNKTWYKRLNQRDTEIRRLEAAQAASAESIQSHIDKRLDEILTSGMTEDDRKAYVDRRELEKRREQDAKAQTTQKNPLDDPQVQQHLASGWAVVKEAGLPIDANDPRVKTVWAEGWNHPDPEGGLSAMRAAAKRVTTPTTSAPAAPSVDIDKLVSERLEAAMDKKLRAMGILKSDSGKPGSASPTKPNSSWDTARLESEQAFRDAGRG